MIISFNELSQLTDEIIEEITSKQNENEYDINTELHREVQRLSRSWWMDFILGIYIASAIKSIG